jgi:hypothetical protein
VAALFLQFVGKVYNGQSLERTLSNADTATNAKRLHYNRMIVFESDSLDLATHRWAKTIAYLTATLGFATIIVKNRYTDHIFSSLSTLTEKIKIA